VDGGKDPSKFDGRVEVGNGSRIRRKSPRGAGVASKIDGSWLPFRSGRHVGSEFGGFCLSFTASLGSTPTAGIRSAVSPAVAALASKGVLLPPGIGVDINDVAVLREAVHEGDHACRAREHGAPLLERQICRHY